MAEKTEQPTQKKLKEGSKKGQILKCRDAVVTSIMFTGALYLGNIFSFRPIIDLINFFIDHDFNLDVTAVAKTSFWIAFKIIFSFVFVVITVVCITSWIQSKFALATESIKLNFGAVNPVSGFKRIFSLRTVKEFVKTILYMVVFSIILFIFWEDKKRLFFATVYNDLNALLLIWASLLISFIYYCISFVLLIIVLDLLAEYFIFMKDMKMDKQEVKKEYKDQEGNPEVKSMRKHLHQELLSEQLKSDVSNSRLIIANPTHIAIGIYYKPEFSKIPLISVKESEHIALAVRQFAEKMKIPVITDVKLARKLYTSHNRYDFVSFDDLTKILDLLFWLEEVELANMPLYEQAEEDSTNQEPD